MSEQLMQANYEWATRPDDERFGSLDEMYLDSWEKNNRSRTQNIETSDLEVIPVGTQLRLKTPSGDLRFNHHSFRQTCTRLGIPASYMAQLKPELAARNLNDGIERMGGLGKDAQIYRQESENGVDRLLALTSQKYTRINNHDIIAAIKQMPGNWTSPLSMLKPGEKGRPATAEDLKYGSNLQVGEQVSLKRALYAGDQDMFAFMVDNDRRINDGTEGGLGRGFFVSNSQVGLSTLSATRFFYRFICRNNIIWGAQDVVTISVKHIGNAQDRWNKYFAALGTQMKHYAESSAQDDEQMIRRAKACTPARNLEEMQDLLFAEKGLLSKRQVADSYELASRHEDTDGNPNSIWGITQGITRLSQMTGFADERVKLDMAARDVLALSN